MGTEEPHSGPEPEVVVLAKKLRYDLTALQGKVSLLLEELGKLNIPDPALKVCPRCGPVPSSVRLDEHMANVHGERAGA